jgi:hypothetical protein
MVQSVAQMPFEASPRPSGAGLGVFPTGLADSWRLARQHFGGAWPLGPLALTHVEGLGLLIPNPADGPAPRGASGSAANVRFKLSSQPAGSRLPRRSLAGLQEGSTVPLSPSPLLEPTRTTLLGSPRATKASAVGSRSVPGLPATPAGWFRGPTSPIAGGKGVLRGNENKPLTAHSNRNSNDSRKLAILSESTTSNFLIATKLHFSEEKAKRE